MQGAGCEKDMIPSFGDAYYHTAKQQAVSDIEDEGDNDNNQD
jgi:hypothetical protein